MNSVYPNDEERSHDLRTSKKTTTHSTILVWRIPWTEEPGRLQSMGLQRVGLNWAANTFIFKKTTYYYEEKSTWTFTLHYIFIPSAKKAACYDLTVFESWH